MTELTDISSLPMDRHGVRLRGLQMTRIETFTDAAFAFAVTMLVISLDAIPANIEELFLALRGIPAFAISFAQIMLFWYAHHVWSRRYGLDDVMTVFLSSLLVFTVLVFVYPLKAMYSSAMGWFSGGYLPSQIDLNSNQDLALLFTIFALSYLAMSLVIILHYWHAWRQRDVLVLDSREIFVTKMMMVRWALLASPGLLSLVLANTIEGFWLVSAGFVYSLLGIQMPFFEHHYQRRLGALPQ